MENNVKINDKFCIYVKELREESGLSLAEIEKKSGISASYISRIENGHRKNLSIIVFSKLAEIYEKPITTLIGIALNEKNMGNIPELTDLLMENDFTIRNKEVNEDIRGFLRDILSYIFIDSYSFQREYDKELLIRVDTLRDYLCKSKFIV